MSLFKCLINIGVSRIDSPKEVKRIRVLNLTTYIALLHAVFFLGFDFYTDTLDNPKLLTLVLEIVFFSLILFFQHRGFPKFSRIIFTITVFGNLLFHCNYAFKGYYGEYQYLVIPLFSLFLFDKKYLHYILLVISVIAFYVPNYYFKIYPDDYFGYLNASFLFVGVFLIVNFFKRNSERNERKLADELNEKILMQEDLDKKNKELASLNKFQNHFFVNIAHEMGTPITLLKGQTGQLIKKNQKIEVQEDLNKINAQVVRMENLLANILDIAKIEAESLVLNKELYSANKLAQKSYLEFEPLFLEKEILFTLEMNDQEVFIDVDIMYFERVLGNILSNAYKYTSKNGTVVLKVITKDTDVQFSICDNGIGIPKTDIEHIFERFYQSDNDINKASGSGIGLAFSKEIIELHEGSIIARIGDSDGLTITITLPINSRQELSNSEILNDENEQVPLQTLFGKRILVVDDNAQMREYLLTVLKDFQTFEAENGKVALERIALERFDAIVTDYMMPVMDGQTLVKKLKGRGVKVPVVMITARVDIRSKLDMLQLGVDDYLTKPFIEEELLLRLKNSMVNHDERAKYIRQEPVDAVMNKFFCDTALTEGL